MIKEAITQAIIFTDGACLGNPGPGGYAAVVTIAGQEQKMDALMIGRKITWKWVKGHAGHPENERVDSLANGEAQRAAG